MSQRQLRFAFRNATLSYHADALLLDLSTMSRQVTEQYATFHFAIDERLSGDESAYDDLHAVWRKASDLVQERQQRHPLRTFMAHEGGDSFEVERWEFCEPEAYLEEHQGRLTWPLSFHHGKAFETDVLVALRDLCVAAMAEAAGGIPARLVEATTHTVYRETETAVIEGL